MINTDSLEYVSIDEYIAKYRAKFVSKFGREPRYLPTGSFNDNGQRLWSISPYWTTYPAVVKR